MYKKRFIEPKVLKLVKHFKVVLIFGVHQVGKSTLLKHLFPQYKHITFDPVQDLYGVRQDPDLFLQNFPSPIILDEIQYVPQLLPSIKRMVDQIDGSWQYILTGSQSLSMLKAVSESLAGRVAVIHLSGMTPQEIDDRASNHWLQHYLDHPESILRILQNTKIAKPSLSLYDIVWRGAFPGLLTIPDELAPSFWSSYVQTYVERDVRLMENIKDLAQFGRFLGIVAALTAQEVNNAHLAREIDLTAPTAQRWLNLLQYSYLWTELQPLLGNAIKRISKKGKGYLTDTGLACYLQRISSPDALAGHPLWGALFETLCINIITAICNSFMKPPALYHWRIATGPEVDCILERDGILYPIECKSSSQITPAHTKNFELLAEQYPNKRIAPDIILYAGNEVYLVGKNAVAVPFWL